MTWTYDPATDIGRVRRTLPDRFEEDGFWTDEEITSFLDDEGGNWRRATASALEAMASDNVMVLKVIRVQNLQTDGAKVSDALLKRAALLRSQADVMDVESGDAFDSVEIVVNDFTFREKLAKEAIRQL